MAEQKSVVVGNMTITEGQKWRRRNTKQRVDIVIRIENDIFSEVAVLMECGERGLRWFVTVSKLLAYWDLVYGGLVTDPAEARSTAMHPDLGAPYAATPSNEEGTRLHHQIENLLTAGGDISEFVTAFAEPDHPYNSLATVLLDCFRQAAVGKGKERHAADGVAFQDQPMASINRQLGSVDGFIYQAHKKSLEAKRLPDGKAQHEIHGAINYLAGAVIAMDTWAKKEAS